jgi:hypothetical protein
MTLEDANSLLVLTGIDVVPRSPDRGRVDLKLPEIKGDLWSEQWPGRETGPQPYSQNHARSFSLLCSPASLHVPTAALVGERMVLRYDKSIGQAGHFRLVRL